MGFWNLSLKLRVQGGTHPGQEALPNLGYSHTYLHSLTQDNTDTPVNIYIFGM